MCSAIYTVYVAWRKKASSSSEKKMVKKRNYKSMWESVGEGEREKKGRKKRRCESVIVHNT